MRLLHVLIGALVIVSSATAHASESYSGLVEQAIAAQSGGDFERAHGLFARAHELSPNARTLRGMGVTSFQLGRYRRALEELDGALAHGSRPLDAELRESVVALRARAAAAIASLKLVFQPGDAELELLLVDNQAEPLSPSRTLQLDPGLHVLRVTAKGYEGHQETVMLAPGKETELRVSLVRSEAQPTLPAQRSAPPERASAGAMEGPAPRLAARVDALGTRRVTRRRRAAIGLLSAGVVLGALSGGLFALGNARIEDVGELCAGKPSRACTPKEADDALEARSLHRLEHTVTALLITSVASSATSLALFAWNMKARRTGLQLGVQLRGAFLRGAF